MDTLDAKYILSVDEKIAEINSTLYYIDNTSYVYKSLNSELSRLKQEKINYNQGCRLPSWQNHKK